MTAVRRILPAIAAAALLAATALAEEAKPAEEPPTLSMEEFLRLAARSDTEFEEILVSELALRYRKDLRIPARDLVLSVKEDFTVSLEESDRDARTAAGLSKLFPMTGTEVSAAYSVTPAAGAGDASSELAFTLSQPIAENAFGRSTRLLDKIVGIETDVARHQIVEAYEDYLAAIQVFYLDWYEAYENLQVGRSSYQENLKLLENMRQRENARIAKPIDVNKARLQVLGRKDRLVALEEAYESRMNLVKRVLRHAGERPLVPRAPAPPAAPEEALDAQVARFREASRTSRMLRMLEEKSSLDAARDADDLLPSIRLLVEYQREGSKAGIRQPDNRVLAGVSLEWPFSDQRQEAEHEVSKIAERRTRLSAQNTLVRLLTEIRNLHLRLERERRLKEIAEEEIGLAGSILKDESENYTYAKASLNDYISAVNILDNNRFNQIQHEVLWLKLRVEWLRITDRMVSADDIRRRHEDAYPAFGD
ncbi:MAG: TolC family protein [Elusimicrobiota bacterium]